MEHDAETTYHIIHQAILDRRSLTCLFDGFMQRFSPHLLGASVEGHKRVVGFQYSVGKWCCFDVERIGILEVNEDRWASGLISERPAGWLHELHVKP